MVLSKMSRGKISDSQISVGSSSCKANLVWRVCFVLFLSFFLFLLTETGTKEIDIAATLEHLRDQRPDMVKTKVGAVCSFSLAGWGTPSFNVNVSEKPSLNLGDIFAKPKDHIAKEKGKEAIYSIHWPTMQVVTSVCTIQVAVDVTGSAYKIWFFEQIFYRWFSPPVVRRIP